MRLSRSLSQANQRDKQLLCEIEIIRSEMEKLSISSNDELIALKNLNTKLQADNVEISNAFRDVVAAKSNLEKNLENLKVILVFKILLKYYVLANTRID